MDLEIRRRFQDVDRNIGYLRERIYTLECEVKELIDFIVREEMMKPLVFQTQSNDALGAIRKRWDAQNSPIVQTG